MKIDLSLGSCTLTLLQKVKLFSICNKFVSEEVNVSCSVVPDCDPMDCSPPGSSVLEIFQARILEWVAISFSRGSSQPRDRTRVSCTAGKFFTD